VTMATFPVRLNFDFIVILVVCYWSLAFGYWL
jgi:hypothetical protein